MEFLKGKTAETINYTFQTLLVTYLVLLLLEQIQKGFVSNYLNIDYLLIIVILLGIASVFSEQKEKEKQPTTWKDYTLITLLTIAGFIILKVKTGDLGWLSWLISSVAAVLIALLSLLVLDEEEEEEESNFKLTKSNAPKVIGITITSLFALTIILTFFNLSFLESLRIIFGSIYILFLPGLILTFVFFPEQHPKTQKSIDWLERIALSFALSIAIVPLFVFYLNLIGIKISTLSVSLITLVIIVVSAILAEKRINSKWPFKA